MTSYSVLKTATLGDLLLVANETHLTGVYFAGCPHAPVPGHSWRHAPRQAVLRQAGVELQEYLAGRRNVFSVPIEVAGTEFQRRVWEEIGRISPGETITYTELAQRAGAAAAIRAAGTATGKNPLSIVVPCHRIIGKNGSLGGYAGGLARKQQLLALERTFQSPARGNLKECPSMVVTSQPSGRVEMVTARAVRV